MGYLDEDGYLFLTDRKSFMIISGGVNIYPRIIEDALIPTRTLRMLPLSAYPTRSLAKRSKRLLSCRRRQCRLRAGATHHRLCP